MSRPLRIQYPDAWYHVMNRGRRGDDIFCEDEDYVTFIDLLKEIAEDYNVKVSAYCLRIYGTLYGTLFTLLTY